jgi:hypothetical protein
MGLVRRWDVDKPRNAEEQAFWDKAIIESLRLFDGYAAIYASVNGDGIGQKASSFAALTADALLAERRKRTDPDASP